MEYDGSRINCATFKGGRIATDGMTVSIRGCSDFIGGTEPVFYSVDMGIRDFLDMLLAVEELDIRKMIRIDDSKSGVVVEKKSFTLE